MNRAWEIDQIVTWQFPCYEYFYFNENGTVFHAHQAPKINADDMWHHDSSHIMTGFKIPEHLRKYWKESVRRKP
jgi:hypothetical protein